MQQSKMAFTDQPIKVFNNGNMPVLVKYEVYFTGPVPLVPWTYFSPLGWNAKQIPPGLPREIKTMFLMCNIISRGESRGHVSVHWEGRDFTYVDDIAEGVTRVINNAPLGAQNNIEARISPPSQGEPVPGNREVAPPAGGDGVVKKTDAAPYKIYNIGNSSPVPLMEYI